MDGDGLVPDLPPRAREDRRGRRKSPDKHPGQVAKVHLRQQRLRIAQAQLQMSETVAPFQLLADGVQRLLAEIHAGLKLERDGARVAVDLRARDGKLLEGALQLLRRLIIRKQLGKMYLFFHVGRAQLRQHRPVAELDETVHNRLPVHDCGHPGQRQLVQPHRLDDLQPLVHVVGAGTLHPAAAVLDAAPEVAAAHDDADLHAGLDTFLDDVAHAADYIEVEAPVLLARERLAADFQKDPLVLGLCHESDRQHAFNG